MICPLREMGSLAQGYALVIEEQDMQVGHYDAVSGEGRLWLQKREKQPGITQMNLGPFRVLAVRTRLCLLGVTSQTNIRTLVWGLSQEPEARS